MIKMKTFWFAPLIALLLTCETVSAADFRDGGLALCIGIGLYANLEKIESAPKDAEAVATALKSTGGFRRVTVLSNPDGPPRFSPTRKNILNTLRLFANNATRDDALILFFSGHGLLHEGKAYLMPVESEPKAVIDPDAGIPVNEILQILSESRAKSKLLLVDANSERELFPGVSGEILSAEKDVSIIVSCGKEQFSVVDADHGIGLFALAIEDALSGKADVDKNGDIASGEMATFVETYMAEYCIDRLIIAGQTPQAAFKNSELAIVTAVGFTGRSREKPAQNAPLTVADKAIDPEDAVTENREFDGSSEPSGDKSSASVVDDSGAAGDLSAVPASATANADASASPQAVVVTPVESTYQVDQQQTYRRQGQQGHSQPSQQQYRQETIGRKFLRFFRGY